MSNVWIILTIGLLFGLIEVSRRSSKNSNEKAFIAEELPNGLIKTNLILYTSGGKKKTIFGVEVNQLDFREFADDNGLVYAIQTRESEQNGEIKYIHKSMFDMMMRQHDVARSNKNYGAEELSSGLVKVTESIEEDGEAYKKKHPAWSEVRGNYVGVKNTPKILAEKAEIASQYITQHAGLIINHLENDYDFALLNDNLENLAEGIASVAYLLLYEQQHRKNKAGHYTYPEIFRRKLLRFSAERYAFCSIELEIERLQSLILGAITWM